MKNLLIVLLVVAVAAVAFFLGQRTAPTPSPAAPVPAIASASGPDSPDNTNSHGEALSAEPPRTFRGPGGMPMLIAYEVGATPDNTDRDVVKAAVLADMKNHPRNIERSYGLKLDEIKDIAEGRKPFPEALLPKPAAAAR